MSCLSLSSYESKSSTSCRVFPDLMGVVVSSLFGDNIFSVWGAHLNTPHREHSLLFIGSSAQLQASRDIPGEVDLSWNSVFLVLVPVQFARTRLDPAHPERGRFRRGDQCILVLPARIFQREVSHFSHDHLRSSKIEPRTRSMGSSCCQVMFRDVTRWSPLSLFPPVCLFAFYSSSACRWLNIQAATTSHRSWFPLRGRTSGWAGDRSGPVFSCWSKCDGCIVV